MNATDINKCIDYINSEKIAELKDFLMYCRQSMILAEKGRKTNHLKAIKKVLDDISKSEHGQRLAGIEHTADGSQFICSGYMLIKWKTERTELNDFRQIDARESINADKLLQCSKAPSPLSSDDNTIINNLDKYIKLYRTDEKLMPIPVAICGNILDAKLVKKVIDIIGTESVNGYGIEHANNNLLLDTPEAVALICGLRQGTNIAEAEKIRQRTKDFIGQVKE